MTGLRWPTRVVTLLLAVLAVVALGARGVVAPPELGLVVVVAAGLASGVRAGAWVGLLAGWVVDLLPPGAEPLGLQALTWTAAGALAGLAHRPSGYPWWWPAAVTAAAWTVVTTPQVVLALATGYPVAGSLLSWQLASTATLAVVLVPALLRLDHALVRRRWA